MELAIALAVIGTIALIGNIILHITSNKKVH